MVLKSLYLFLRKKKVWGRYIIHDAYDEEKHKEHGDDIFKVWWPHASLCCLRFFLRFVVGKAKEIIDLLNCFGGVFIRTKLEAINRKEFWLFVEDYFWFLYLGRY